MISRSILGIVDSRGESKLVDISANADMTTSFGDPCLGVNKILKIAYKIDGKRGDVAFVEAHDRLVSPVNIFAPTVSPGNVLDLWRLYRTVHKLVQG